MAEQSIAQVTLDTAAVENQVAAAISRRIQKIATHALKYGSSDGLGIEYDIVTNSIKLQILWYNFRDPYISNLRGTQTWLSQEQAENMAAKAFHLIHGAPPPSERFIMGTETGRFSARG